MMYEISGKIEDNMAEYFYNDFIGMYCVIGTTYSSDSLKDLIPVCGQMVEVEMPEYITEDYDGVTW